MKFFKPFTSIQLFKGIHKEKQPVMFQTKQFKIKAYKVITYPNEVYVAENVFIKPKALHNILKHVNQAMKDYNISELHRPTVVIADEYIMGNRLGLYNAVENVVYFRSIIGDKKTLVDSLQFGETEYHELWHVKQAERYKKSGKEINEVTKFIYIKELRQLCKEYIDKNDITKDNITKISRYASIMFDYHKFDEIEAEMMVNKYYRKRGSQNVYHFPKRNSRINGYL